MTGSLRKDNSNGKRSKMELKKRVDKQELQEYPVKKFPGKAYIIDNIDQVQEAVEYLSEYKYIGFDTESKPTFVKGKSNINPIALMQLSSGDRAYLFRINRIGMPLELKTLLEDTKIFKIGSAVHGDIDKIADLDKKGNFVPKGFVDIQNIATKNGIETVGLKRLTAILLNFRISKKHQLTNWEAKELSIGQINYAAMDAWACYKIYEDFLKRRMV